MVLNKKEVLINIKKKTRTRLKKICRMKNMTYDDAINDYCERTE